jgi:hypothetical protein
LGQARISKVFQEAERRELDRVWVKLFYKANIPFVVSKNKAFREAMRKIAEFCRPYLSPSYHDLCRKFLV